MMYGREITLPVDLVFGRPEDEIENESCYAFDLAEKIEEVHELARKNIEFSSGVQKRAYDHKVQQNSYGVGDLVWFYEPRRKKGKNKKLSRPWKGPYVIIKKLNDFIFRIQLNPKTKPKVVHHDRLKPYNGEDRPTWFNVK